ncbi:hypothetical protein HJC23_000977 [Cyclotella cryptica]|uniref:Secreted protein n=1 Tax=Cyclotella cryptica TaxID=29204 RepID=A0ABD3QNK6_9STRA
MNFGKCENFGIIFLNSWFSFFCLCVCVVESVFGCYDETADKRDTSLIRHTCDLCLPSLYMTIL